jgi:hypothetical protein
LAKYHIDSIQQWDDFYYQGKNYDMGHLNAHEVVFKGKKDDFKFIVTYGLHCFAKDNEPTSIPYLIKDGREEKNVDLERYEASKSLRSFINTLSKEDIKIYQTTEEKFFTLRVLNNSTGEEETYKICIAIYKENRKLRIHVISAFFARRGEGSPSLPVTKAGYSIFKLAIDIRKKDGKNNGPKEAHNRIT